jgi:hypothetical protein
MKRRHHLGDTDIDGRIISNKFEEIVFALMWELDLTGTK